MLGAGAMAVGALIALELIVSVLVRPLAGVLADTRERTILAAVGALIYAASCVLYAFSTTLPLAYLAAVVGGVGWSLLVVTLRAIVSERLKQDSGVFARLMSAQETGSWVAFVGGLTLLGYTDSFRTVFLLCAGACAVGAVLLATSLKLRADTSAAATLNASGKVAGIARMLRPMLIVVALTGLAESAIGILLLLHLQRGLGLGIIEIAFVFMPGAIAMAVLPRPLHSVVKRIGRRKSMVAASVFSAVFAISLAWAPSAAMITVLWILSGVAFAMVMPIEQAAVAEAGERSVGRAMGTYDSVGLIGAAVGVLAAGALYEISSWQVACVVFGAVILSGAVLGPWALNRLRVTDIPVETREGAIP